MIEKLRLLEDIFKRLTMHRHAAVLTSKKRCRANGFWFRLLWIVGYLGVTVAATLSILLLPVLISKFKLHTINADSYPFYAQSDVSKGDGYIRLQGIPSRLHQNVHRSDRKEALDLEKQSDLSKEDGVIRLQGIPLHLPQNVHLIDRKDLEKFGLFGEWWRDLKNLWKPPPNRGYKPCVSPSKSYQGAGLKVSRGYLLVNANGGLNQMRAGICDMVAVARLINATLVIPHLDKRSFWQDSSTFSDVFDEDNFIKSLEGDVSVVKKLPKELLSAPKVHKHFRSWSSAKYYQEEIVPLWEEYKVIHAAKADSRLVNNNLAPNIQKLRCRVCYDALRFAPAIEALGKKLLERMRSNGPFIALHLRYEKDMLAFSGCTHGLADLEIEELTKIRENTPHWKVKVINSTEQRLKGFCPLTPKEVGIFLQALGYPATTRVYIAAGELYGGNGTMAELQARFPNLLSKELIATRKELAPFSRHASQLAALDYIVSVESDVFVPSYSGNMARAVEGHRRFLGHRKTISPDRSQLVALFNQLDEGILQEGPEFSSLVVELHRKRLGAPRKRRGPIPGSKSKERFKTEEGFYTNPLPDCLCQKWRKSHTAVHLRASYPMGVVENVRTNVSGVNPW